MAYTMSEREVQNVCQYYGYEGDVAHLKEMAKEALLNKLCVVVSGNVGRSRGGLKRYRGNKSSRNHRRSSDRTRKNRN